MADTDTAPPEGEAHEHDDPGTGESEHDKRLLDRAEEIARKVASEVARTVLGDRTGHDGPAETGEEGGGGEDEAPEPSSPRQIEAASEDAVRAAVERIAAERDHEEHHKHLKEAERPPQQFSRLTKALWGDR